MRQAPKGWMTPILVGKFDDIPTVGATEYQGQDHSKANPIAFQSIIVGDLVDDFSIGLKRAERMGKTGRDGNLLEAFAGQFDGEVLAKRRRWVLDIYGDVQDPARITRTNLAWANGGV